MSQLLDRPLLDELDQRLRDLGAPVLELLRPGLSEEDIQAVTRQLGIRLPHEAMLWWEWHNGTRPVSGPAGLRYLSPNQEAISLEEAVRHYEVGLRVAAQAATDDCPQEYWWESSWFPILGLPAGSVVCDCDVAPGDPTPLRFISPARFDTDAFRAVRFTSLGELVRTWIAEIKAGLWVVENGQWR